MSTLTWSYEQQAYESGSRFIVGVDEAGRGSWAGPVVAAAVIFKSFGNIPEGLNDSKKLTRKKRQNLFLELTQSENIFYGVGEASVEEVDRHNVLQATYIAMHRAIEKLTQQPDFILVDGRRVSTFLIPQKAIIEGDGQSPSIAAASILAKETRDCIMEKHHDDYPVYAFDKHKGYGTATHQKSIEDHGPCPLHRRSFAPIAQKVFSFLSHR
jgi:ribonuclease HII